MKNTSRRWLFLSATTSFLAVGIPYWRIPYNTLSLPDALPESGLFVVAVSALLLSMYGVVSFLRAIGMIGASVAAAVMIRVLVEGAQDPTSHNLWPFELVIALAVGLACAAAGAVIGGLFRWLKEYFLHRGK